MAALFGGLVSATFMVALAQPIANVALTFSTPEYFAVIFFGLVSVGSLGGGSVMDTAKAANLLSSYPDELIAYINAPIGRAKPIPGRLKPHIACPTTCGTGSETTGITIVDLKSVGLKTGIASPLRGTGGI